MIFKDLITKVILAIFFVLLCLIIFLYFSNRKLKEQIHKERIEKVLEIDEIKSENLKRLNDTLQITIERLNCEIEILQHRNEDIKKDYEKSFDSYSRIIIDRPKY